jgi:hypothetical protein
MEGGSLVVTAMRWAAAISTFVAVGALVACSADTEAPSSTPSASTFPSRSLSDSSTWTFGEKSLIQDLRSSAAETHGYTEATGITSDFSAQTAAEYLTFAHRACDGLATGEAWGHIAVDMPSLPQEGAFMLIGHAEAYLCPEYKS